MAAIRPMGDPLTMKAIAGPEPSAIDAVGRHRPAACGASPAKAIDSASTPYFWNMGPLAHADVERDEGKARARPCRPQLVGRPGGRAVRGRAAVKPDGKPGARSRHRISSQCAFMVSEKGFRVKPAHVPVLGEGPHLDEGAPSTASAFGSKRPVSENIGHQLFIDAGRGRRIRSHHVGAISTLSVLSRRISENGVEPSPPETARLRRSAMILSVAKITWIWKSFTKSLKRSRMRPRRAERNERRGEVDDAAVERFRTHRGDACRVLADPAPE